MRAADKVWLRGRLVKARSPVRRSWDARAAGGAGRAGSSVPLGGMLCVGLLDLDLSTQRDPEVFLLAKWYFGGLGYQGQTTTDFPEQLWLFVEKVCLYGLGTPGLQQTLGQLLCRRTPHHVFVHILSDSKTI